MGRIVSRQKNFHLFYDLIENLQSNNIEVCFMIFGNGEIELLNNIKRLSNDKTQILHYGFNTNWQFEIPENSIQIFLSDYEGCPLALLEAYKNNHKLIAVLDSPGLNNYVSNNCIFSTVLDIANAIKDNNDFYNRYDLSIFFDNERHSAEVESCFSKIFKLI